MIKLSNSRARISARQPISKYHGLTSPPPPPPPRFPRTFDKRAIVFHPMSATSDPRQSSRNRQPTFLSMRHHARRRRPRRHGSRFYIYIKRGIPLDDVCIIVRCSGRVINTRFRTVERWLGRRLCAPRVSSRNAVDTRVIIKFRSAGD